MKNSEKLILAPISVGELFDKITILVIKLTRFSDKEMVLLVIRELEELNKLAKTVKVDLTAEIVELGEINLLIWNNENEARTYGKNKPHDEEFIRIVTENYAMNTRRALIKQEINRKTDSVIFDTKTYLPIVKEEK